MRPCGAAILRGSRKRKECLQNELKAVGTLKLALTLSQNTELIRSLQIRL